MSMDTPPFDPSDYSYVIGIGKYKNSFKLTTIWLVAKKKEDKTYRFWYNFFWLLLCLLQGR